MTSVCMITSVAEPVLFGIPKIFEHDFLCELRYCYKEYQTSFLMDILHTSWEIVVAMLQLR